VQARYAATKRAQLLVHVAAVAAGTLACTLIDAGPPHASAGAFAVGGTLGLANLRLLQYSADQVKEPKPPEPSESDDDSSGEGKGRLIVAGLAAVAAASCAAYASEEVVVWSFLTPQQLLAGTLGFLQYKLAILLAGGFVADGGDEPADGAEEEEAQ